MRDFAAASGPLGKLVGFFHACPPETRRQDLAYLVADGRLTPALGSVRDWQELDQTLRDLRERKIRGKAILVIR
jgi:hypothetical protein